MSEPTHLEVGNAPANLKSATFGLKVIRADGTVEDLGVVSRYDRPTGFRGFLADVRDAYRKARDA